MKIIMAILLAVALSGCSKQGETASPQTATPDATTRQDTMVPNRDPSGVKLGKVVTESSGKTKFTMDIDLSSSGKTQGQNNASQTTPLRSESER